MITQIIFINKVFCSDGKLFYRVSYEDNIKVYDQARYKAIFKLRDSWILKFFFCLLCFIGTASWKFSWPLEAGTLELLRKSSMRELDVHLICYG